MTLDEALTSRDTINAELRTALDEATQRWGVRVERIEVKSIDPPRGIQEAMEKQMRAERDRRAAILTAEGEKQSQVLTAEGAKQAQILKAEGDRQAQILRAEGEGKAITTVFDAIHAGKPTPDLLSYQYLKETLPKVADGTATKMLLVPSDAMGNLGMAAPLGALFGEGQATGQAPGRPPLPPRRGDGGSSPLDPGPGPMGG